MAREVKDWQEEIRLGMDFQQKYGGSKNWGKYREYLRHKFPKGIIPVNKVHANLRTIVAQTYPRNPKVVVSQTKSGAENWLKAQVCQSIANYLLKQTGVKRQIKKMCIDGIITGNGTGIYGYDSEWGWSPSNAQGEGDYTLTQFSKDGKRIEFNERVYPGMPWFLRTLPEDVIWPWGTQEKENAPWVALRFMRRLEDLKRDKKYSNVEGVSGTYSPMRQTASGVYVPAIPSMMGKDRKDEWVELWQVHDLETGTVMALTIDGDKLLRKDEDLLQGAGSGLPVDVITFNEDPEVIYGVSDVKLMEPQQLELNDIRTQAAKHRRADVLKLLVAENVLSQDDINRLTDESVKAVISVKTGDRSLRDIVLPMTGSAGGIMQDMAFAGEQVMGDIREMLGQSRVAAGETLGKTHVSATEVGGALARGDIRLDERKDEVADLIVRVVNRYLALVFEYWKEERVTNIVGPQGGQMWLKYNADEIKGQYEIRIDPYSGQTSTPETKKAEALEMAKAWAEMNQAAVQQGKPVPAEIQRFFFSQYEGLDVMALLAEQGLPVAPMMGNQQAPMGIQQAAQMMEQGAKGA